MSLSNPLKAIAIPESRHAQLQELARVRNCTVADIIGQTIKEAIDRKEIPDTTPGLCMTYTDGMIRIQRDRKTIAVAPSTAIAVAATIERHLNAGSAGKAMRSPEMEGLQAVSVRRHGQAVIVRFVEEEFELALSVSVAADVARQLRAVAHTSSIRREEPVEAYATTG